MDFPAFVFAGFAPANLLLVFGLFRQSTVFCLVFKGLTRLLDFLSQVFATRDLLGNRLAIVIITVVRFLRSVHELPDILFELEFQLLGSIVTNIPVPGRAGFDVRAVDADRSDLQNAHGASQLQHMQERRSHRLEVLTPKRADRVVVRMGIRRQEPNSHISVARPFDATRREDAVA